MLFNGKKPLLVPFLFVILSVMKAQGTQDPPPLNKMNHGNFSAHELEDEDKNAEDQTAELTTGAKGDYSSEDPIIIEMLVAVSPELANQFNDDMSAMITYFKALFIDVDHRFKTLAKTNISFRVTSIEIFQDQEVVKHARTARGTVDIRKAIVNFGEWVFKRKGNFSNFDMAMGVIFPDVSSSASVGLAYYSRVCQLGPGTVASSFVVILTGTSSPATVVAHEIAHVMGAHHDDATSRVDSARICTNNFTSLKTMNPTLTGALDTFSFSWCSDEDIAKVVSSEQGACLRRLDNNAPPIIDTSLPNTVQNGMMIPLGVSMATQCQILQNSSVAARKPLRENQCGYTATCVYTTNNGNKTTSLDLHPLDGTPCGANGHCFQGNCFPVGTQLVSVANGQCLTLRSSSADDWSIVGKCPRFVTPLNMLTVGESGIFGRQLMTSYISPDRKKASGVNCLSLHVGDDMDDTFLSFKNCSHGKTSQWFGWKFTEYENGQFQIHHYLVRDICLRVSNDTQDVKGSTNCSGTDAATRFILRFENGTTSSSNATLVIDNGKVDEGSVSQDNAVEFCRFYVVSFVAGCLLSTVVVVLVVCCWKASRKISQNILNARARRLII